jgi:hypothetical protein
MRFRLLLLAALGTAAVAGAQPYRPPRHTAPPPAFLTSGSPVEMMFRADAGTQVEQNRSPAAELEEHRKLDGALRALAPHRRGIVDAYVLSIALDSDPVFGREAREAAAVLQRRYGASGRTIVLAGSDGSAPSRLPRGTPATLAASLARVAELMDRNEDVIILYTTSHGARFGLYYNDADSGYGAVSPNRLASMLDELGIANRMLIISACYSGIFVPRLRSAKTVIVTAAAEDRTSFGCAADNDWTYFGDAMINRALRKPQPLAAAFVETVGLVSTWEAQAVAVPSLPQLAVGEEVAAWLNPLEQRIPRTPTAPVGRPAFEPARTASANR